jgi:hypothetical protein
MRISLWCAECVDEHDVTDCRVWPKAGECYVNPTSLSKPNFMKFHQVMKFHEISGNISWSFMKFHETRVDEISWNISWTFMKFHETLTECFFFHEKKFHETSWNLIKFHEILLFFHKISWNFIWKFLWHFSWNFMKFHDFTKWFSPGMDDCQLQEKLAYCIGVCCCLL